MTSLPSKPVRYAVERAVPEAVAGDLRRIWRDNLHVPDVDRKFDWLYRDNPDPAKAVFLLGADDGADRRWVGTAGVAIRRFQIEGVDRRAGLLADLAVDREHRTVMPALALVRAVRAWTLDELDFAYGFPNQHAEGVFRRVGYRQLGTITRYVRVLRHAGYARRVRELELPWLPRPLKGVVEKIATMPHLAAAAGRGVDAVTLGRELPGLVRASRRFRLAWGPPDARWDRLWDEARRDYPVVAHRNAAFLRWRFDGREYEVVAAVERRGGAVAAYAVIEALGGVAHLRDLFGRRAAIGPLLDLLIPALYRRGQSSISIRYLGAEWVVAELRARHFLTRQSERMISVGCGDRLPAAARVVVEAANAWHLTDADEDA